MSLRDRVQRGRGFAIGYAVEGVRNRRARCHTGAHSEEGQSDRGAAAQKAGDQEADESSRRSA